MIAALLHNSTNPQVVFDELEAISVANARSHKLVGQVSCCPLTMDFTLLSPYPVEGLRSWKPALGQHGVNIGQFVLTGEPVATMGNTSLVASILATASSQPVLYIEFRKDGTPIDPGPWWATSEGEKVRG